MNTRTYDVNLTNDGFRGCGLEKICGYYCGKPETVSPKGKIDLIYKRKHYEIKTGGGVLLYKGETKPFKGSGYVIYAPYVEGTVTDNGDGSGTFTPDILGTDFIVVDKAEFVEYVTNNKMVRPINKKGNINLQTVYNTKRNQFHGKKWEKMRAWAMEHTSDPDDILTALINGECEMVEDE